MNQAHILGLGTAVPPFAIDQPEAARFASLLAGDDPDQARRVAVLYRRAGIRHRHLALLDRAPDGGERPEAFQSLFTAASPGHAAGGPSTAERMACYADRAAPLAARAACAAFASAHVSPDAITHLITVSCTGFAAPGVDILLMHLLGLDSRVERVHVGFMGCQGALNGLRVAAALARSAPSARVLLCAVELCGLHLQYSGEPDAIVANSLFADGAAAAIVGRPAQDGAEERVSLWRVRTQGAGLVPGSHDAMTWTIGDHGFTMTLSPRVPHLIETHLRGWMDAWLAREHVRVADVRSWAIHPGGTRIVTAAEAALELDGATAGTAAREVLANFGNMSSPTILFVLKHLVDGGAPRPCVALAFGPGLSIEAALLD